MAAIWESLPDETATSYAAFRRYYEMPPAERSLAKVAVLLKHNHTTTVEKWSSRFNWVSRALAYDNYISKTAIEVRRVGLTEAQEALVGRETLQAALIQDFVTKMILDMKVAYDNKEPVDTKAVQRLMRVIMDASTLARRALKLPTAFKTEIVDDPTAEGDVFFIGD